MSDSEIAAWIQASPQWAIFATIVAGGIWALIGAQRARRMEAARWLHQMNLDFYKHQEFDRLRIDFDRNFSGTVGRVLQLQILHGMDVLDDKDTAYALQIDNYLNYFENLLYLVECDHLTRRDLEAMYAYWLSLFSLDGNAAVRVYAATFGYERVARQTRGREIAQICCSEQLAEKFQANPTGIVQIEGTASNLRLVTFSNQETALAAIKSIGPSIQVSCGPMTATNSTTKTDVWFVDPPSRAQGIHAD
jgi:hypothetical protein